MIKLDMDSYARKAHFDYFKALANPYVGVTANVDITDFLTSIKRDGYPFFLSYLWLAAKSANAVRELRQRIFDDGIVEFDVCGTSHTVAKPDGTYAYCALNCQMPLSDFIPYAKEAQLACVSGGDIHEDSNEALSRFFVSTVPWFSYTAIVQPTPTPADSNPRITWGRHFTQGDRTLMPVSILCNHALVDGLHIASFYEKLERGI